jgi:hypothetical protein
MSGRRYRGRFRAARALIALAVAVACLGGVAFAATRSERVHPQGKKKGHPARQQAQRPPRPNFIEVPPAVGVGGGYQFRFHVPPPEAAGGGSAPAAPTQPTRRRRQFECRLDGGEWDGCSSPYVLGGLGPAEHTFAVRALSPREVSGPAAHYRWTQLEPKPFTVDPLFDSLEELMPGAAPQPLPLQISNPNPVPIEVTSLTVTVSPDRPGCAADPNFAVVPSSLSPTAALSVPAGGSVALPNPSATAPTLELRELPVDQNACQGATLNLSFSGEARG